MFKKWSDDLVIDWWNNNSNNTNIALAIHTVCALSGRKRVDIIKLLKTV